MTLMRMKIEIHLSWLIKHRLKKKRKAFDIIEVINDVNKILKNLFVMEKISSTLFLKIDERINFK